MAKRFAGTTLAYDATDGVYRKTEIYESDNPNDTVELRIIDDFAVPFTSEDVDDGVGPWQHIMRAKEDIMGSRENKGAMRVGPFVLEQRHIKPDAKPDAKPDETVEGIPFVGDR